METNATRLRQARAAERDVNDPFPRVSPTKWQRIVTSTRWLLFIFYLSSIGENFFPDVTVVSQSAYYKFFTGYSIEPNTVMDWPQTAVTMSFKESDTTNVRGVSMERGFINGTGGKVVNTNLFSESHPDFSTNFVKFPFNNDDFSSAADFDTARKRVYGNYSKMVFTNSDGKHLIVPRSKDGPNDMLFDGQENVQEQIYDQGIAAEKIRIKVDVGKIVPRLLKDSRCKTLLHEIEIENVPIDEVSPDCECFFSKNKSSHEDLRDVCAKTCPRRGWVIYSKGIIDKILAGNVSDQIKNSINLLNEGKDINSDELYDVAKSFSNVLKSEMTSGVLSNEESNFDVLMNWQPMNTNRPHMLTFLVNALGNLVVGLLPLHRSGGSSLPSSKSSSASSSVSLLKNGIFSLTKSQLSVAWIPASIDNLSQIFLQLGIIFATAQLKSIVYTSCIVWAAVFSRLYLHRRLSLMQWVGVFVVFFGIVLKGRGSFSSVYDSFFASSHAGGTDEIVGFFLILAGSIMHSLTNVINEKIIRLENSNKIVAPTTLCSFAGLVGVVWWLTYVTIFVFIPGTTKQVFIWPINPNYIGNFYIGMIGHWFSAAVHAGCYFLLLGSVGVVTCGIVKGATTTTYVFLSYFVFTLGGCFNCTTGQQQKYNIWKSTNDLFMTFLVVLLCAGGTVFYACATQRAKAKLEEEEVDDNAENLLSLNRLASRQKLVSKVGSEAGASKGEYGSLGMRGINFVNSYASDLNTLGQDTTGGGLKKNFSCGSHLSESIC